MSPYRIAGAQIPAQMRLENKHGLDSQVQVRVKQLLESTFFQAASNRDAPIRPRVTGLSNFQDILCPRQSESIALYAIIEV